MPAGAPVLRGSTSRPLGSVVVVPPAAVTRPSVLVIGAGAAGLCAAARIHQWADVVVVDKGRGVGGRLATRRIGDATFDHGAQFLTTHDEPFRSFIADLADDGIVQPWFVGPVGPRGVDEGNRDGHVRWRSTGGMTGVAKHLARGLDVRCGCRVSSLRASGERWFAAIDADGGDSAELVADAIVLTAPVPQSLALLAAGGIELGAEDSDALGSIEYDPCLAVLAPLESEWCVAPPGVIRPDSPSLAWVADNALKGVSPVPALTLHATAPASRAMWDVADDVAAGELLRAAAEAMGGDAPEVDHRAVQVQRWRYSIPVSPHPHPCLEVTGLPPLVVAGDAFGGPRVEGAVRSGWAAAGALHDRLVGGSQRRV